MNASLEKQVRKELISIGVPVEEVATMSVEDLEERLADEGYELVSLETEEGENLYGYVHAKYLLLEEPEMEDDNETDDF